jgi:hypothetical protein
MVAANIAQVRFGRQTSGQGTPLASAAASDYGLYIAGGTTPEPNRTSNPLEETTGARMRSDRFVSDIHVEGDTQYIVRPTSVGALLYGAMGAKAVSGSADPWTHTFTMANTLPWWTFFRSIGAMLFERFVDCKITRLVFHSEAGQPLTVTAMVLGLKPQFRSATEANPTIETAHAFLHTDGVAAFMVEGVAVAHTRSFDLTIENNGSTVPGDAVTPYDVTEGELTVTVGFTQLFTAGAQGDQLRNRILYGGASPSNNADVINSIIELAGSPVGIRVKFTRGGLTPVSPERSLQFDVPRITLDPPTIQPSTASEPLTQALQLYALAPSAGASPITATLKNGVASYA